VKAAGRYAEPLAIARWDTYCRFWPPGEEVPGLALHDSFGIPYSIAIGILLASTWPRSKWIAQADQRQWQLFAVGCGFIAQPAQATRPWFLQGRSGRPHHAALAPLDSLDSLFLLDASAFPLGQVIVVAAQDRLDVLLKVFTELADFFSQYFLWFRPPAFSFHLPFTNSLNQGLNPFAQKSMTPKPV